MVVAIIAEVNRDEAKRKIPFSPADFMPGRKKEKMERVVMTPAAMMAEVERLNILYRGVDKREKPDG